MKILAKSRSLQWHWVSWPIIVSFRLLQSRWARSSTTHRRTESLRNGKDNWQFNPHILTFSAWQNMLTSLSFSLSLDNLFPITACRCRNESTRHDCRFVSCVSAHNARCSRYVQSSNYLFAFFSTCHLQFIEKRSRPCAKANCKGFRWDMMKWLWLIPSSFFFFSSLLLLTNDWLLSRSLSIFA